MTEAVSRPSAGAPRLTTMQRALFWLLVGALLPLAIGAAFVTWQQFERERNDAERALVAAAESAAVAIDLELAAGFAELGVLSNSPLIDVGDWQTFHGLLTAVVAGRDGSHITLADRNGQMMASTTLPLSAPMPNLWQRAGETAEWNGHRLPLSSQTFSRRIVEGERPAASRLYVGISVQRPAVSIGLPVRRGGTITHAILLSYAVETFAEALSLPNRSRDMQLTLLDPEGRVILSTGPSALATGSFADAALAGVLADMTDPAANAAEGSPRIVQDADADLQHVVASTGATRWRIVATAPRHAAFMSASRGAQAWLGLFLVTLLGGSLFAATLSRRITAPFARLADATRAALHGDTPQLPATRFVEIDALGRALVDVARVERERRVEVEARHLAEQRGSLALQQARMAVEAEYRLRQLIDNLYAFVGVLDLDGVLTEVNVAPLEAAGVVRDDVVGRTFWDCCWWNYDPDVATRVRAAISTALAGEPIRLDVPARMAGGRIAMVDLQIRPLFDDDGKVLQLIPSGVDVSDRVDAVRALRDSEQRFRAMADHMPQLAWISDSSGRAIWYNRRWHDFVGSTGVVAASDWRQYVHPDHLGPVLDSFARAMAAGEPWEEMVPLRGADGEYRWFLSRAEPFSEASGAVTRWFGTQTDVSEQRATEHALRDSENRLIENEAKLREADRQKDTFIATLAHELRNPLAPILMSAEIIGMHAAPGSHMARAQQAIQRQASHMSRLIDDLLDVSRIKHDLLTLDRHPVDLREVVAAAIEAARPGIDAAGQTLEVDPGPPGMTVDADLMRLAQALLNVLNNASKFSPPGSVISIGSRRDGDAAQIIVRDRGIGIASDMLDRVFDIFVQEGRSGVGGRSGLGIGLALSRSLVQMHGGSITAHSDGNATGSTFTLSLPLSGDVLDDTGPERSNPSTRARTILVVDDNVDAAETLATMLSLGGHTTHVAHDGAGALELHARHRPEITVLDIGLPDMTGYDVARRLRADHGDDCGVLIALTGWGQESDRQRSQSFGFRCHLTKPASPEQISEVLAALD
jgi:PAS domain S-box-containing protein